MKSIPPIKLVPEPLTDEARNLLKFKWAPKEIGTSTGLAASHISCKMNNGQVARLGTEG